MKEKLDQIINTYNWIKVKRFTAPDMRWNTMSDLPAVGTICEIIVDGIPHHGLYEFVESVGASDRGHAFQLMGLNSIGLYECAFFLHENLVTHWRISPYYILEEHHKAETEFLIKETRKLASVINDLVDGTNKRIKKAKNGKRFGNALPFYEGRESAFDEILLMLHDSISDNKS